MVSSGATPDFATALTNTIAASLGCAVLRRAMYLVGAAGLAQMAPYPVIAGMINATGLLIMLSPADDAFGTTEFLPAAMLVTAVTMAVNSRPLVSWRFLAAPLLAGTAAHFAIIGATGGVGPWHSGPRWRSCGA